MALLANELLDLGEPHESGGFGPSEDTIKEALQRSQRAVRLLQDPDFVSWRKDVEVAKERHIRQLIGRTEDERTAQKRRGIIVGVEGLFAALEIQAAGLEEAGRRLEEYEQRRTEPVAPKWWSRGL